MDSLLRILVAGPGVTLQDAGRLGYLRFGVTPAVPMDRLAFDTANQAVGNPPGATAIEVGLGGLEVVVQGAPLAAGIAGGNFAITLDGRPVPPAVLMRLDEGAVLRIVAGAAGAWCYLALGGRLLVPPMLGSTATHTRSGFGGIEGRGLASGDQLSIAEPHLPAAFGALTAPWLDRPADVIRVILGPQDDYFAVEQVAAFLAGPWRLSARGDRMAYFLEGPKLTHAKGFNIVSDGIAMGAIQVPGAGQPIVLMADRQPTGGYPKIATVIGPDLGRLAQARPGQILCFRAVALEDAVAARHAERELLEGSIAVSPLVQTDFSSSFLLARNLTDGVLTSAAPAMTPEQCHAVGRLTARERLEVLFDAAHFDATDETAPTALVLATGRVEGRLVYAASRNAMVRGGALTAAELHDLATLISRAVAEQAPVVLLFDGLAVTAKDDAATLVALAELHAVLAPARAPCIAVALGPCLGPDALTASLADFLIVVAGHDAAASDVRGAVQSLTTGSSPGAEIAGLGATVVSAAHDVMALLHARRLLDFMPDRSAGMDETPASEAATLDRLVPHVPTEVYDIRDVLAAIADEGEFLEIAPDSTGNIVVAFARFGGCAVGILANQPLVMGGALDAPALAKAARFAERCADLALPLLTVVDCPGVLPGPAQERAGLLPQAAALLRALARSTMPRVTLITRHAIGPVASLMGLGGGNAYHWPSARISLLGGTAPILPLDALPPLYGRLIQPRETRRSVVTAFVEHVRRPEKHPQCSRRS